MTDGITCRVMCHPSCSALAVVAGSTKGVKAMMVIPDGRKRFNRRSTSLQLLLKQNLQARKANLSADCMRVTETTIEKRDSKVQGALRALWAVSFNGNESC